MTLDAWNDRLAAHFAGVRAGRLPSRPVFALEHGLSPDETSALSVAVRDHLRGAPPTGSHRLPLVVYAAEYGYRFDGNEYWPAFERETPGWTEHGSRDWIKLAFLHFHTAYGGVHPSGPWAEHRTIIAWPITHAVLPADLQRHFTRALWNLRALLRILESDDPADVGRHIRAAATGASGRFHTLCQQPALVGQLALALFEKEPADAAAFLDPALVDRIAQAVRTRAEDRALFDEARHAARIGLHGLRARGAGTRPSGDRVSMPTDPTPRSLGLGVDLTLRPRLDRDGAERWDLVLHLPDLRPLVAYRPGLHDALDSAWLDVEGSDRALAPGALLGGRLAVVLDRLPDPSRPLLTLDTDNARLQHLVGALGLDPAPLRLFRVAADGAAREVRGRVTRPEQSYVLLASGGVPDLPDATPIVVTCADVQAVRFSVPDPTPPDWAEALEAAGVPVRSTVALRPAGAPPVAWDGAGSATWLATDAPTIAVSADGPIELLELSLDGGRPLHLDTPTPGAHAFVSLGSLPPGPHTLSATAVLADGSLAEGVLDLCVRPLRSWQPSDAGVTPLRARITPLAPTIRDLLAGDVSLEAYGPPGVKVRVVFCFTDSDGHRIGDEIKTSRVGLPLTPDGWAKLLDRHVLSNQRALGWTTRACSVHVTLDGGALGRVEAVAERTDELLRWDRVGDCVRLLDDRDSPTPLTVEALWADRPLRPEALDPDGARAGLPTGPGGILHATDGTHAATLLVGPTVERSGLEGLAALRPDCDFGNVGRTPASLAATLTALERWGRGERVGAGSTALSVRLHVLSEGACALAAATGETWARAERQVRTGEGDAEALADHIPSRSTPPRWRDALPTPAELASADRSGRVDLLVRLGRALAALPAAGNSRPSRRSERARWLAELALRLASAPHTVVPWAGGHLDDGLAHVLDHPPLIRAARYVVLSVPTAPDAGDVPLTPYPSWSWPSRS